MVRSIASLLGILLAVLATGAAAQETTRTFQNPSINGVRLDWCRFYGRQCGEPAAELFCRQKRI